MMQYNALETTSPIALGCLTSSQINDLAEGSILAGNLMIIANVLRHQFVRENRRAVIRYVEGVRLFSEEKDRRDRVRKGEEELHRYETLESLDAAVRSTQTHLQDLEYEFTGIREAALRDFPEIAAVLGSGDDS